MPIWFVSIFMAFIALPEAQASKPTTFKQLMEHLLVSPLVTGHPTSKAYDDFFFDVLIRSDHMGKQSALTDLFTPTLMDGSWDQTPGVLMDSGTAASLSHELDRHFESQLSVETPQRKSLLDDKRAMEAWLQQVAASVRPLSQTPQPLQEHEIRQLARARLQSMFRDQEDLEQVIENPRRARSAQHFDRALTYRRALQQEMFRQAQQLNPHQKKVSFDGQNLDTNAALTISELKRLAAEGKRLRERIWKQVLSEVLEQGQIELWVEEKLGQWRLVQKGLSKAEWEKMSFIIPSRDSYVLFPFTFLKNKPARFLYPSQASGERKFQPAVGALVEERLLFEFRYSLDESMEDPHVSLALEQTKQRLKVGDLFGRPDLTQKWVRFSMARCFIHVVENFAEAIEAGHFDQTLDLPPNMSDEVAADWWGSDLIFGENDSILVREGLLYLLAYARWRENPDFFKRLESKNRAHLTATAHDIFRHYVSSDSVIRTPWLEPERTPRYQPPPRPSLSRPLAQPPQLLARSTPPQLQSADKSSAPRTTAPKKAQNSLAGSDDPEKDTIGNLDREEDPTLVLIRPLSRQTLLIVPDIEDREEAVPIAILARPPTEPAHVLIISSLSQHLEGRILPLPMLADGSLSWIEVRINDELPLRQNLDYLILFNQKTHSYFLEFLGNSVRAFSTSAKVRLGFSGPEEAEINYPLEPGPLKKALRAVRNASLGQSGQEIAESQSTDLVGLTTQISFATRYQKRAGVGIPDPALRPSPIQLAPYREFLGAQNRLCIQCAAAASFGIQILRLYNREAKVPLTPRYQHALSFKYGKSHPVGHAMITLRKNGVRVGLADPTPTLHAKEDEEKTLLYEQLSEDRTERAQSWTNIFVMSYEQLLKDPRTTQFFRTTANAQRFETLYGRHPLWVAYRVSAPFYEMLKGDLAAAEFLRKIARVVGVDGTQTSAQEPEFREWLPRQVSKLESMLAVQDAEQRHLISRAYSQLATLQRIIEDTPMFDELAGSFHQTPACNQEIFSDVANN